MSAGSARYVVILLTAINLLNYIDRYLPSAVKDLFKDDLHLTDFQTSLPFTAFVLVFVVASPIFGSLADTYSRKKLIAIGVAIWSLATAGAAFAWNFPLFFAARALVGIGEAAYATIAPALISDLYPAAKRNRVLTIFYVAIPIGSAIGFGIGGFIGSHFGWRIAFLLAGIPGLFVAALALFMSEPRRGQFDKKQKKEKAPTWPSALKALRKNRVYLATVAGYTLVMFAAGGIAEWFPTFLVRHRGYTTEEAGFSVGMVMIVAGIGGTAAGGILGDKLVGRTRHPYLALAGFAMIPATIFATATLFVKSHWAITACLFTAQFFAWFYNGPINTVLVNSVPANLRARAFSLSILSTHVFGDAISPPVIGFISDHGGGLWLALGLIPLMLALGTVVWLVAWRFLPEQPDAHIPRETAQALV